VNSPPALGVLPRAKANKVGVESLGFTKGASEASGGSFSIGVRLLCINKVIQLKKFMHTS